jgi:hypothetical protein
VAIPPLFACRWLGVDVKDCVELLDGLDLVFLLRLDGADRFPVGGEPVLVEE